MSHHADQRQTRRELVAFLLMWVAVCLLVLFLATGCVSQGEYQKAIDRAEGAEASLAAAEAKRLRALRALADAEARFDAILEYLDEDEARIRRALLSGAE